MTSTPTVNARRAALRQSLFGSVGGLSCLLLLSHPVAAQWNPAVGQWGKTSPNDIRVMTWNVRDTLCTSNNKVAGANNWAACARIVASMKPDILMLQETADNSGNGTGSGVDSVANLTTTLGYFLNGGNDTFKAGNPPVTAYVQLYAPGFTFPYMLVSSVSDGFNRNCILSRFPFADLNGDTRSTLNDIPNVTASGYAPGGNGGIRGFAFAEIALPNATYAGDLVIGTAHLKAGSAGADHTQRVTAAANVAYYIDAMFNGLGTTMPDPGGLVADNPVATSILGPETPVIIGGDWNEDELTNGATVGPAQWLTKALSPETSGGTDGTDRNRTDMTYDAATDPFTGSRITIGNVKFDHVAWQDSIVALRRAFVFDPSTIAPATALPPELVGYPTPSTAGSTASDHHPVVADFILPGPLGCNTAAVDLGFGKLGTGGVFPRFTVCGLLASGNTGTLALVSAPPNATFFCGISFTQSFGILFGGTVLPNPTTLIGPFATNAAGGFTTPVTGGGGPFSLYAQCAILDPGATSGVGFSNALRINFLP